MDSVFSFQVDQYHDSTLSQSVETMLQALFPAILRNNTTKVVIKPNLLTNKAPDKAITTHPKVVQAVVDWLSGQGITHITLAESGSGEHTVGRLKSLYHTCGMANLQGISLNWDTSFQAVPSISGDYESHYNVITPIAKADVVINIAKLKTHGMTTLTGGAKNLFGVIPGLQKPELHFKHPESPDFCGMLVDLAKTVAPQVTIIDAIDCMEGDGPSGGTVRHLGYLFSSANPFAVDYFAAQVMGIAPNQVEMLVQAQKQGYVNPENIQILGNIPENVPPFVIPKSKSLLFLTAIPPLLHKPILALATRFLRPVPKIKKEVCIGCGKCAESCPMSTITMRHGKADISLKRCISCLCCHEMCPVQAIDIKRQFK